MRIILGLIVVIAILCLLPFMGRISDWMDGVGRYGPGEDD